MKKFLKKRGFTLVELLVVIAVISVLLSIGIIKYFDISRKSIITSDIYSCRFLLSGIAYYEAKTASVYVGTGDLIEDLVEVGYMQEDALKTPKIDPTGKFIYDSDKFIVQAEVTITDRIYNKLDNVEKKFFKRH